MAASITNLKATLDCLKMYYTHRKSQIERIWFTSTGLPEMEPNFGQTQLAIPIELRIDPDCPPSRDHPHDRIDWGLHISGSLAGADLDLFFEIPVF